MDYEFLSLASGIISILFFQLEQSLRSWLDSFIKSAPQAKHYNQLSLIVRFSAQIKAHEQTIKNVLPVITFFRVIAVILSVVSLIVAGLKKT